MSVQVIDRRPRADRGWRPAALVFAALFVALTITVASAGLNIPGSTATHPAAASNPLPPLTVTEGRRIIQRIFTPTRLKGCVRLQGKFIRCKGYGSYVAPYRWVYLGVFRDGMGNLYPNFGEI